MLFLEQQDSHYVSRAAHVGILEINPFLPFVLYFPKSTLLIVLSVIHLKLPVGKYWLIVQP